MKLHHLRPADGATTDRTRVGRGRAGTRGKTAGRGTKGTGARKNVPTYFDGEVTPEALYAHGLAHKGRPVKILGRGELGKALTVSAHAFSATARAKIEAAGGRVQTLGAKD
jgi:large subunit ribosomal protein L15